MTDSNGNLVEHDSYDAWGKHRQLNGADDANNTITSKTTRGFTDQEQIQDTTLINMNARVYDPVIGRFLSPDPMIQDAYNLQDLNAYSYVDNDPLSITDPTGMCKGLLGCLGGVLEDVVFPLQLFKQVPILGQINIIATATACSVFGGPPAGAGCAAAATSITTLYDTGNLGLAAEDGAIAGAEALAFGEVGSYTDGYGASSVGQAVGGGVPGDVVAYAAQVAGDGLVGGLASSAQGGASNLGSWPQVSRRRQDR